MSKLFYKLQSMSQEISASTKNRQNGEALTEKLDISFLLP